MNDGWKCVAASVRGTSHLAAGTDCQDNHTCTVLNSDSGPILLALVSDGAGSAARSAIGSRMLCDLMKEQAEEFFATQGRLKDINPQLIAGWIEHFRNEIIFQADSEGLTDREFACTLLGAIASSDGAVFFQIGDGAIVYASDLTEGYSLLFWPERGEYENTTYFATQATFFSQLQFKSVEAAVQEIALFSDGLQRLALNYQTKTAHQPFFKGLFPPVRLAEQSQIETTCAQLSTYLDSPKVNERTDDDKTLILAVAEAHSSGTEARNRATGSGQ